MKRTMCKKNGFPEQNGTRSKTEDMMKHLHHFHVSSALCLQGTTNMRWQVVLLMTCVNGLLLCSRDGNTLVYKGVHPIRKKAFN